MENFEEDVTEIVVGCKFWRIQSSENLLLQHFVNHRNLNREEVKMLTNKYCIIP
jgi:hypothetical protein